MPTGIGSWKSADRFVWPREEAVLMLGTEQLHWLLDGIDIEAMRAHRRAIISA